MFPHIFPRWGNIGVLLRETLGNTGAFCSLASYNEFPHISAALPHFQGLLALSQTSKITSPRDPAGIGNEGEASLIYIRLGVVWFIYVGETLARFSPFLFIVSVMDAILF